MNEERSEPSHKPSWLERLGLALIGEPKDRDELMEMLRDGAAALSVVENGQVLGEIAARDVMARLVDPRG